ncbi:MAG: sodium:solute symporter family transporter [Planctomycetota bacterium]|jgi:SSS family solute:Na+ symporter
MKTRSVLCGLLLLFVPSVCQAAEEVSDSVAESGGLTVLDWGIIVAYGIGTLALGWWYSRRQKSTQEYFVGSGKMNPFLVGVSLFATLLSTISYMSMPGESLGKGPVNMLSMFALPVVFAIVGFVLLPVYMKQRVTSAYELLEERLGLSIRMLGASMFVLLRLVWMSLLIYLTAKALTIMIGVGEDRIPLIALITGFVAVIYTSLGGLRAVIITDFMQTVLLYGGALLVLGTITYDLGGIDWVPKEWNPAWDTQPFFSSDLSVRVTVVGTLLNYLVWYVCTSGGDQTSVQRFMATEDAPAARRALATQLCVSVVVAVTLGLVGFALFGYFTAHPELVPAGLSLKDNADKIFPHFIAFHLPPGISGLVVAAMFAAAMSSIDSGVNSITAVVMTDVLDRFGKAPKSERQHVLIARLLAFGIGAVVVLASSQMGKVPGNITAVTTKTSNLLTTPIFGLFFFALFVPNASPKGVWIGAICGTATAVAIAFSGPILLELHLQCGMDLAWFSTELVSSVDPDTGETILSVPDLISFQWIAPVAISVNVLTGLLGCIVFPRKNCPTGDGGHEAAS